MCALKELLPIDLLIRFGNFSSGSSALAEADPQAEMQY